MDTIKRADLIRAIRILGFEPAEVASITITSGEVSAVLIDEGDYRVERSNVG